MNLRKRIEKIQAFVMRDVWNLPGSEKGSMSFVARLVRVGHLLFRGYVDDDLTIHASSLTFVTLTSLVPILAVGFALVRGLGMGEEQLAKVAEMEWIEQMPEQFQVFVQQVLDIVNTTNFSALGWIGLVIFVLTAVLLLANVEKSFNRVWGVDKNRSLLRQITNYTSVLVLVPLLIGVAGGLKAQIAISEKFFEVDVNAWVQNLLSFAIMWLAIGFLYVFVPNTRVRLRPAAISSLFTTLVFLGWMRVFAVMQTGVARYNLIYGAFAAVPVFLFWMYVTWVILLLGAEFTFALQNSDTFQLESAADSASMRSRILVALMILRRAGQVMEGGREVFDAAEFARINKAPIRLINAVVGVLVRRGYLAQVASRDAGYVLMRAPDAVRIQDLVSELLREGGGHPEVDESIRIDEPLRAAMAQIERGLTQGFGDLTLAAMAAGAPADRARA
ncbi:MAG: YihY/virulence factor BrkB family protein [Kiritimatiellae bacterium]|jgi:membrane protein|nr:YihY/virulence factor BrkB family protein [Kiritimatiellia bacterium]MDD3440927.1 YihY/virulence factor BrkB family protein [Kiritimatiellia bacterium]NCC92681.1 YihY/virulence factor BrkB family protein [Opitutae bacterium]HPJ57899.1 YihY/virulence factor BrkB family protein [Kiritimatiellia bacterium]